MSDVIVIGSIVGMPDVWGNRFPASQTFVELLTTYSSTPLGVTLAGLDGTFSVVSSNHSPDIPLESLYLRLGNNSTLQPYVPNATLTFGHRKPVLRSTNNLHLELKRIEPPWVAEPRVIAAWNGREFKYPCDFVRSLITSVRGLITGTGSSGSLQLIRPLHTPFLGVIPHNDSMFLTLETERKRTDRAEVSFDPISGKSRQPLTEMLAKAIVPALGLDPTKVRNSKDAFLKALEYFSDIRFNKWLLPSFDSFGLAQAVGTVFGVHFPEFFGFEGRASFCGLVFAAAAVDAGLKIRVTFAPVGAAHVTIIDIS